MEMKTTAVCNDCQRFFNLKDEDDANEFYYGHDCEEG